MAGYSAGGHVALMMGLTNGMDAFEGDGGYLSESSDIQAVYSLSGVSDVLAWYDNSSLLDIHDVLIRLLGTDAKPSGTCPEEECYCYEGLCDINGYFASASPFNYIPEDDESVVPIKMIHGRADIIVPYINHTLFRNKLDEFTSENYLDGYPYEYIQYNQKS